jgi:hypothetical protein
VVQEELVIIVQLIINVVLMEDLEVVQVVVVSLVNLQAVQVQEIHLLLVHPKVIQVEIEFNVMQQVVVEQVQLVEMQDLLELVQVLHKLEAVE